MSRVERTDEDNDGEPVHGSPRIPAATPISCGYAHLERENPTAESEIGGRQRYVTSFDKSQTDSSLLLTDRHRTRFESAKRGVPTV